VTSSIQINDVNELHGECTMCAERGEKADLHANKGDVIIIYPMNLMGKFELVVLCKSCFEKLEVDE